MTKRIAIPEPVTQSTQRGARYAKRNKSLG